MKKLQHDVFKKLCGIVHRYATRQTITQSDLLTLRELISKVAVSDVDGALDRVLATMAKHPRMPAVVDAIFNKRGKQCLGN